MIELPIAYAFGSFFVTLSPFPRGSMMDRIWCSSMIALHGGEAKRRFTQATGKR